MHAEMPSISGSSYTTANNVALANWANPAMGNQQFVDNQAVLKQLFDNRMASPAAPPQKEQKVSARIVKVFIADPNENLPLESRVLYSGAEKLTDLTDQELFFEVAIGDVLAKHNELRSKTVDKKQAEKFGRDIYLEPARIRDLKMVVVTIAQF